MKKPVLIVCLALLASCETLHFYGQAIGGQLGILTKRRDIQSLIEDPATDSELRTRLQNILAIREFAETELSLPVADNFSTYVDTGRPFVVWNVFAAPEFSLDAQSWCYPVAGCVTYRGYFNQDNARRFADTLKDEGLDVYVGGVAAYSTLGWFSDSVLNTVIYRDNYRLAALIFHELAHQVVYIPGDTEFNESFATAVELEGLRRWLIAEGDSARADMLVAQASLDKQRRAEFVDLVQSIVPDLQSLYASHLDIEAMRTEKARLFDELRDRYEVLKKGWNGDDAYDGWFASDINNAKINTVGTYFNRVPAFDAILAETNHDLPAFYQRVKSLSEQPETQRRQTLDTLAGGQSGPVLESASITTPNTQEQTP